MGFCGTRDDALSVSKGVLQNDCFIDVLNLIPHAIVLLICLFILIVWSKSFMGRLEVKTWVHFHGHSLRWVLTLFLIVVTAIEIGEGVVSDSLDPDTVNLHVFIPQCLACAGAVVSIVYYHNVEQWNSPRFLLVLMVYWLFTTIFKILKAVSLYKNGATYTHLRVWLTWIDVVLYFALLMIELHVLRKQRYAFFKKSFPVQPPEELEYTKYIHSHVNLLSKLTFWWVNGILMEGFKHPLQTEDLGTLPANEGAARQHDRLQTAFIEEKYYASQKKKELSFHRIYLRAFWKPLFAAGVLRLFGDLLAFVGPWCVEHIVDSAYRIVEYNKNTETEVQVYDTRNITRNLSFVQDVNDSQQKTEAYIEVMSFLKNGYVLCVILFVATILQHSFLQNHYYKVIRLGIRMRAGLQTMIYRKTLKISSLSFSSGQLTNGQILNHMSTDTVFLMLLFFVLHFIWAGPLQIVIALIMMYFKLGVSALIGGSLVILTAPVNYYVGKGLSKMQKKVMLRADKRVKKCNEAVQGIKVIKLLAWEAVFKRSISHARREELKFLFYTAVYRVLMSFISISIPAIGTMITFVIYPYLEDEPLTVGRALSTLSLFNILNLPVTLITYLITTLITADVSAKRLLPFFMAPEVEGLGGKEKSHTHSTGTETIDFDACSSEAEIRSHADQWSVDPWSNQWSVDPWSNQWSVDPLSATLTMEGIKLDTIVDYRNGTKKTSLRKEDDTSSQSSLESTYSRTPVHSRRSSRASLLDSLEPRRPSGPALTVTDQGKESSRRRHTSGVSTEDEDEVADTSVIIEPRTVVEIVDGNFSWDQKDKELCIKNINIKIPAGKLTIIVGPVGSGKSSLLLAMLGEMLTVEGSVDWNKGTKIAYAAQRPWLINSSLKENILFGQNFSWRRYNKVVQVCALQQDLSQLPAGDMTEIGEKGINLSGGQKQRVSIARALYSKADTVILDDPLSALDAHVGKQVFDEALMKRLVRRKRTVILVTHQLQYLNQASHLIVMKEGEVQYQGKLTDVKKVDPDLYESWRRALREAKASESSQSESKDLAEAAEKLDVTSKPTESQHKLEHRRTSSQTLNVHNVNAHRRHSKQLTNMEEETSQEGKETEEQDSLVDKDPKKDESEGKLIKKEHRETGAVALKVYCTYIKACTVPLFIFVVLMAIAYHGFFVASNLVLSSWSEASTVFKDSQELFSNNITNTTEEFDNSSYMRSYSILNMVAVGMSMLAGMLLYLMGVRASKVLHLDMLDTVLHVPVRFFDTNPTGRIMNRFSSDLSQIDQKLPFTMESLMRCLFLTLSSLVVNTIGTPYFLFAAVPMVILYCLLQAFFRYTAREIQRIDNITKSPVFSQLSETLNGMQTIRAYRAERLFQTQALKAINGNTTPLLYLHTINRWLGIRLDYFGALLVFAASLSSLIACMFGQSSPALVGLSVTYALIVSFYLNWIVRNMTEVEMIMNSVERVKEYVNLKREPEKHPQGNIMVDKSWPDRGKVEYRNVSLQYDENLDFVVTDASFVINAGEKVGVCGRTGSGKSSLALSLFRMINMPEGQILIDDKDTARITVDELRSKLAIIPQDPVLFTGTIRFNLDPDRRATDEQIWEAIETVQMKDVIKSYPEQLESSVTEGGENFSTGQKQLLCLARAFIRENKILVLDEATASIDLETDNKLQAVISTAFKSKTVITIAHRLSTILKYDRVMVLDNGQIMEFDVPSTLLKNTDSLFYSLIQSIKK